MTAPTTRPDALTVLRAGVDSYAPYRRADGELVDPVVLEPTQYGTAYHAWGNAVLAAHGDPAERDDRAALALAGVTAALAHVADPEVPPTWSGFDRATGAAASRGSHRDFCWPPILRTLDVLDRVPADADAVRGLREQAGAVDPDAAFTSRPPSNWAMVWMSGEYLRLRDRTSPIEPADFDRRLATFFREAFVPGLGLYAENGVPNAYDLFTRVHLAEILAAGYRGLYLERARDFLTAGLRRSLAVQLSDGSLASGYRSAGQTWTLGAQVLFFTRAATLALGTADERTRARAAAGRAFDCLARWQRRDAPFSPVLNRQPPWRRVGYERYTADGHYANLALGFLASAIEAGFTGGEHDETESPPAVWVEGEPTWRATAHRGRLSVGVQAQADLVYDGTGLVDLTTGPGRLLQLSSSARHLSGGPWINPGLGVRTEPGRTPTAVVSGHRHTLTGGGLEACGAAAVRFTSTIEADGEGDPIAGWEYRMDVEVADGRVSVRENTPGHEHHPVLFLPYPADLGDGLVTTVAWLDDGVEFTLDGPAGTERIQVRVDRPVEARLDLGADYANRRGMCGLVRLDLEGPAEGIGWSVTT